MTAVRIGAHVEPGKVTDPFDIRPPTDVMAITSLPHTPPFIPHHLSFLSTAHISPIFHPSSVICHLN
jgi:hypothetical protein